MKVEKHDTSGSIENTLVPVSEKYTLTIKEAASYFNIGTKKMRRLDKLPPKMFYTSYEQSL